MDHPVLNTKLARSLGYWKLLLVKIYKHRQLLQDISAKSMLIYNTLETEKDNALRNVKTRLYKDHSDILLPMIPK
jgi:hypothetical protein